MTPTQSPTLASQATAELPELPDVEELAHEIAEECLSFGLSAESIARYLRSYDKKVRGAIAADRASRAQSEWQPIETAPKDGRTMFVVRGFDVTNPNCGAHHYTTDPYCVWPGYDGGWVRWPHVFPPTHWVPLPATPGETK